jgi:hypothetical protein
MGYPIPNQAERGEQIRTDPIGADDEIRTAPAAIGQAQHTGGIGASDARSQADLDTCGPRRRRQQIMKLVAERRPEHTMVLVRAVQTPVDPRLESPWRKGASTERFTLPELIQGPETIARNVKTAAAGAQCRRGFVDNHTPTPLSEGRGQSQTG